MGPTFRERVFWEKPLSKLTVSILSNLNELLLTAAQIYQLQQKKPALVSDVIHGNPSRLTWLNYA